MNWKKIVFAIAICLIYIPMVFMAVNTFFPETPRNECYNFYPVDRNLTEPEKVEYNEEMRQCEEDYREQRTKYDSWKFIVIMMINIIAVFFMLTNIDKSVIFGLFFGVVITAFIATMSYMESRSVIGFALLVLLFGLIIYFVNKMSKNKDKF